MIRARRFLQFALLGLTLAWAAPAPAQSFEGLETPASKKKKRSAPKKKGASKRTTKKAPALPPAHDVPPPAGAPAAADTQKPAAAPAPTGAEGLDLSSPPAGAQKPAAPTMQFEAVDVSGKSPDRQRVEAANNLFKSDNYEGAAMAANELLSDPKMAALHPEAEYVLAKSLYRMGLYHSSLSAFSRILARGPTTKFFKSSMEWLFFISRKTKNETVVLDQIARYANYEFPERFRNEFRYLLARYHFVRGRALDRVGQKGEADKSFEEVRRIVSGIPRADPFYPRAKYLEGLAHFRAANQGRTPAERRSDPANARVVESMKEIVRMTRPGSGRRADQDLRELAFMQLARTHYGMQQNRYAIFYYGKVERGTQQWLDALFEASWAHYRIGQYEQALGNLITLSSPFFRDEYFPEALILKSVIYYENCRYRESTLILQDFERTYLPVHDQLQLILGKNLEASEYYNVLAEVQKKNKEGLERSSTDVILERILRLALTDQDLRKTNESILELEGELDAYGAKGDTFKYSDLSKRLMEDLKKQRGELIGRAGIMAKGKLEAELANLKELLANGLRIKFETTTKEKEFLEEQLRAGGRTAIVKKYKYSVAVADDQLYWPYEGEYWRDELGTYQYTLTKGCIERDRANRDTGSGGW